MSIACSPLNRSGLVLSSIRSGDVHYKPKLTQTDVGEVGQLEESDDLGEGDQVDLVELAVRNGDDQLVEEPVVARDEGQDQDGEVVLGPELEDLGVDLLLLLGHLSPLELEDQFAQEREGLLELQEVVHRVHDLR